MKHSHCLRSFFISLKLLCMNLEPGTLNLKRA